MSYTSLTSTINKDKKLPLSHHSLELKVRFFYTILSISSTFCTAYFYSEQLCMILADPLLRLSTSTNLNPSISFIYTNLTEAFFSYLKISAFVSIVFTIPFILFQIWMFIIPGLYLHEKRKLSVILIAFFMLVILGLVIAYNFIIPIAWKFFLSFETQNIDFLSINLQPKIDQYLSLVISILITLSISFHLPIYLYLILRLNILSHEWVVLKRNISLLMMFILAAIISPPDVLSQILIVIPLFLLYELVVFLIVLSNEYDILTNKKNN